MSRVLKSMMFAALLAGMLVTVLTPKAAAQNGSIAGTVLDINAKPWFGLNVQAVSDQGAKLDVKTDAEGKFAFRNLRPGVYTVTITTFPAPNEKQPPVPMGQLRVTSGEEAKADMNFKDIMAKQGAEAMWDTPQEFTAFTEGESAKWGKLIHDLGIKVE